MGISKLLNLLKMEKTRLKMEVKFVENPLHKINNRNTITG